MPETRNSRLARFVQNHFENCTVLVLGDVMLDRYYFGEVKRISPEAPVPVTRILREKDTLGGASNVAHNVALLGCKTILAGVVGEDENQRRLCKLLSDRQIDHSGLLHITGPTTTKVRVIGGHQQMLRLDFEESRSISPDMEEQLKAFVRQTLANYPVSSIIISDYAKGVCTPDVCQFVIEQGNEREIPVIIDPKGTNWQKYIGSSYITPNLKELQEVTHFSINNEDEDVKKAAQSVRRKYHVKNLVVTRSEKGLSLIGNKKSVHIPTLAQEVFDVSGAGDTVIAVLAAALATGLEAADAAYLANAAAGFVVGKVGTYAISQAELINTLQENSED